MTHLFRYFFLYALLFSGSSLFAQKTALDKHQDTLVIVSQQIQAAADDETKIAVNAEFVKRLVNALKIPYSYNYKFDSLKSISAVKSPDNAFRLITWYLTMSDGSYRYYGTIQISTPDGKLKLIPLQDGTSTLEDKNGITSHRNWFGARYYDIIPVQVSGKAPYYVLLGWKGVNDRVSSKLVEILTIDKDAAIFGKPVFDGIKGSKATNRYLLQYNRFNSMLLQRDPAVNLIVMDHLVAIDPSKQGIPEFYASDSSFDAFKIIGGRLKLLENVELLNPPDPTDDFYNDPRTLAPAKIRN